jgi:tRNA G18 (ribose-2'-O)-methylase SpoU
VTVPNGIGQESETATLAASNSATSIWIPPVVLQRIRRALWHEGHLESNMPWSDLSHNAATQSFVSCGGSRNLGSTAAVCRRHGASCRRQLIVVASLLVKRPNIAGLCRTCELMGACEIVVNDMDVLNHVQSREISHSAENSVPITEIPRDWLMRYLEEQRRRGFQIIAVEQASNSVSLESFTWPERAVLLLGKEKEGIPSQYLRAVDKCVEIPQLGIIRSLNVHVSGAIMMWDHC